MERCLEEGEIAQDEGYGVQPSASEAVRLEADFLASEYRYGWDNRGGPLNDAEQLQHPGLGNQAGAASYAQSTPYSDLEPQANYSQRDEEGTFSVAADPSLPWCSSGKQYADLYDSQLQPTTEAVLATDALNHENGFSSKQRQGLPSETYQYYDASQNYGGCWQESNERQSEFLALSGQGQTEDASTYGYADYSSYYAYGQDSHTAGTYSSPPDTVQRGDDDASGLTQPLPVQPALAPNANASADAEADGIKQEPRRKGFKKPDKTKVVLGKNKPIVQANFLSKLNNGGVTKPQRRKVQSKYEAEMQKYQNQVGG